MYKILGGGNPTPLRGGGDCEFMFLLWARFLDGVSWSMALKAASRSVPRTLWIRASRSVPGAALCAAPRTLRILQLRKNKINKKYIDYRLEVFGDLFSLFNLLVLDLVICRRHSENPEKNYCNLVSCSSKSKIC